MEELARMGGIVSLVLYVYILLPFLLLTLLIGYVLLRVRDQRNEVHDPDLGIKAALHFFLSVSLLLLLNGLTIVAVDAVTAEKPQRPVPGRRFGQPPKNNNETSVAQRTGWGFVLAGLLLSLLHFGFIKGMTNDSRQPAARRLFLGWRFALHGLMVLFAVTGLIVTLFQKDLGDDNTRKTFFALLLVWVPSWVTHLLLLHVSGTNLYRPRRLERPTEVFVPSEPVSRPRSGPRCAHCDASLSEREIEEGWCDTCGKKVSDPGR